MATSKLIKGDTLTETSNAADGFNPATEVSAYSYTSARVAKPVYNKYKASTTKPKVFGYYTDWSQYDGRLQAIIQKITAVAATTWPTFLLPPTTKSSSVSSA